MGQADALLVPGDFKNLRTKWPAALRRRGVADQSIQKRLHPLQPQGCAKPTGEQCALLNGPGQGLLRYAAGFQIFLQQLLTAHGQSLRIRV